MDTNDMDKNETVKVKKLRSRILILLSLSLAISVSLYLLFPRELERTTLFFPDKRSGQVATETRFMSKTADLRERARDIVEGLFAGPQDVTFGLYTVDRQVLKTVFVLNNQLYIDLEPQFQDMNNRCTADPKKRIELLKNTIRYNLPTLGEIFVYIGGIRS